MATAMVKVGGRKMCPTHGSPISRGEHDISDGLLRVLSLQTEALWRPAGTQTHMQSGGWTWTKRMGHHPAPSSRSEVRGRWPCWLLGVTALTEFPTSLPTVSQSSALAHQRAGGMCLVGMVVRSFVVAKF